MCYSNIALVLLAKSSRTHTIICNNFFTNKRVANGFLKCFIFEILIRESSDISQCGTSLTRFIASLNSQKNFIFLAK